MAHVQTETSSSKQANRQTTKFQSFFKFCPYEKMMKILNFVVESVCPPRMVYLVEDLPGKALPTVLGTNGPPTSAFACYLSPSKTTRNVGTLMNIKYVRHFGNNLIVHRSPVGPEEPTIRPMQAAGYHWYDQCQ